ncbi:MAG: hypothetical protein V3V00_13290, partial [Saprospiraceae bacterium]
DSDILLNPDLEDINKHITEIKTELGELPKSMEEKALQALLKSYKTKLIIIERIIRSYEISQSKNNTNEYDISDNNIGHMYGLSNNCFWG